MLSQPCICIINKKTTQKVARYATRDAVSWPQAILGAYLAKYNSGRRRAGWKPAG